MSAVIERRSHQQQQPSEQLPQQQQRLPQPQSPPPPPLQPPEQQQPASRVQLGLCHHCCGSFASCGGYSGDLQQVQQEQRQRRFERIDSHLRVCMLYKSLGSPSSSSSSSQAGSYTHFSCSQRLPRISPLTNGWADDSAVSVLQRWVLVLRETLTYVNFFLARASPMQQVLLAPTIWRELHQGVSNALRTDNSRMRGFAERQGQLHYNAPVLHQSRPPVPLGVEPTECHICMEREPNVALDPCGHCFCSICISGITACPMCRRRIDAFLHIFL